MDAFSLPYLFYFERVFYLMIEITKSEAKAVRKVFPHACIAKTRHKRYLEESARYLEVLIELMVDRI